MENNITNFRLGGLYQLIGISKSGVYIDYLDKRGIEERDSSVSYNHHRFQLYSIKKVELKLKKMLFYIDYTIKNNSNILIKYGNDFGSKLFSSFIVKDNYPGKKQLMFLDKNYGGYVSNLEEVKSNLKHINLEKVNYMSSPDYSCVLTFSKKDYVISD